MNIDCVPFKSVEPSKALALKPLEEAAEVFGAWQNYTRYEQRTSRLEGVQHELVYECYDLIQATVNLMYAFGADSDQVNKTLAEVRVNNEARGRDYAD